MRKRKAYEAKTQISFAFGPPNITASLIQLWTGFKKRYSGYVILLLQDGLYFTIGIDALILHEVTGRPIQVATPVCCYFDAVLLSEILGEVAQTDLHVAVCVPPERPEMHLFM